MPTSPTTMPAWCLTEVELRELYRVCMPKNIDYKMSIKGNVYRILNNFNPVKDEVLYHLIQIKTMKIEMTTLFHASTVTTKK